MFCEQCGSERLTGGPFCSRCGSKSVAVSVSSSPSVNIAAVPALVFKVASILGWLYLYIGAFGMFGYSLIGLFASRIALEAYFCWMLFLTAFTLVLVGHALRRGRTAPDLLTYGTGVIIALWLFESAHGGFRLNYEGSMSENAIPHRGLLFFNIMIASGLAFFRLKEMWLQRLMVPLSISAIRSNKVVVKRLTFLGILATLGIISAILARGIFERAAHY